MKTKLFCMKLLTLITVFALLSSTAAKAQTSPKPADEILKEACQQAASENKNVFIMFHASWCGWCRKLDASLNDASCKQFFDDNYVIKHMVVYESKGKEKLETPGVLDLLAKYKANDNGVPYWFIFDKDGKLLADSKMRPEGAGLETGDNIGCPANKEEVAYFLNLLQKTSKLNPQQLEIIRKRFRKNE